jgi:nucleoside-diphosphate-sugar epimerase
MAPCDIFNIAAADTIGPADSLAHAARMFGALPDVRKAALYQQVPGAGLIDITHAREILGWEPTGRWADVVEPAMGT